MAQYRGLAWVRAKELNQTKKAAEVGMSSFAYLYIAKAGGFKDSSGSTLKFVPMTTPIYSRKFKRTQLYSIKYASQEARVYFSVCLLF
jgi:hypothetical protein